LDINILIIEDDEIIRDTVKTFLIEAGYQVDACSDGAGAMKKFAERMYRLVILDIMLPDTDGHELLRIFRGLSDAPVLMMTALSDEENQIRAFDAEADDYVTKPFKIQLLLKRAEALLRRSGALSKEISYGNLLLFPEEYQAVYRGVKLPLTLKEFELLSLLVHNKDRTFNKDRTLAHETILSRIWGYDYDGDVSVVHTHIKNLRAKLPANLIKNVRGVGYRIEKDAPGKVQPGKVQTGQVQQWNAEAEEKP